MKTKDRQPKKNPDDDPIGIRLQKLYSETERWQSELRFFDDELVFFRNLMNNHFLTMIEPKFQDRSKIVIQDMNSLEKFSKQLADNLKPHLKHLGDLIEYPVAVNTLQIQDQDEHNQLKSVLKQLELEFRTVKKEVFELTDAVMKVEKSAHLIGRT